MTGISALVFRYPVQEDSSMQTAIFAEAARLTGSELVVNISQLLQRSGDQPTRTRPPWLSEQVFDWADVGAVQSSTPRVLRNLGGSRDQPDSGWGASAAMGSRDHHHSMVSAEDVARVAVGVLTGPARPNGTVVPLIGDAVTNTQIVEALSEIVGRPVPYREISDEQWVQNVAGAVSTTPPWCTWSILWRHIPDPPGGLSGQLHRH